MNKKLWRFNFNTAMLVLIPATVAMNYLGKLSATLFRFPVWLDSIGTCLASMVAGPITGAIVGVINNIIYGLTINSISTIYALTSVVIAVAVGIFAHKGFLNSFKRAVLVGVIVGILSAVISTPLNVCFWSDAASGMPGEAVFMFFQAQGMPIWLASFLENVIIDVPDKVLVLLAAYAMGSVLPESLLTLYQSDAEQK